MVFNQRLRLLLKISSGIRLVVGYNNSSKRSSIQVAFNQRLRLFVKVLGSRCRWRSTKGCVSYTISPPAFGWLSVITTAAKGPLFKWRQTKGFVSSSRSLPAFGWLSVITTAAKGPLFRHFDAIFDSQYVNFSG